MARDAVLEVNIENANARKAFINFWRTMEAQGYQYGFEALCNVWVGFDDGRSDLAQKVLKAVKSEQLHEHLDNAGYRNAVNDIYIALCELFQREGIDAAAPASLSPVGRTWLTSLNLKGRCDHGEVLTASCDQCAAALRTSAGEESK